MVRPNSQLCGWWDPATNGPSPDCSSTWYWGPTGAGSSDVRIPSNAAGNQPSYPSGSTDGYLGIVAYNPTPWATSQIFCPDGQTGQPNYQYVATGISDNIQTGEIHSVLPGEDYYGELQVSMADRAGKAVGEIGMFLTERDLGPADFGLDPSQAPSPVNSYYSSLLRQQPYTFCDQTLPDPVRPQIYRHALVAGGTGAFLSDKVNWMKVAGCFRNNGPVPLTQLVIGNFRDEQPGTVLAVPNATNYYTDLGCGSNMNDLAYYYLAGIRLHRLPNAGPVLRTAACGASVTLGEACDPMPASSGVQYQWFYAATAGDPPTPIAGATASSLTSTTSQSGFYSLRVRVPHVDRTFDAADPTTYYEKTSTTELQRPLPAVFTLTASPPAVCQGQTVTLTATTVPGANYVWTQQVITGTNLGPTTTVPGATSAATCTPTPTGNTTIYTVYATLGSCQSPTVEVSVEVLPAPTLTALNGPESVCQGQPVTLTTTGNCPTCLYQWTSQPYDINHTASPPEPLDEGGPTLTDTPPPTASYIIYSAVATYPLTGCSSVVRDVLVQVLPAPVVTIKLNGQSIGGTTLVLAPTDPAILLQGGPTGGTWTDPVGGLSCTSCATPTLNPASLLPGTTGVLTYSYTNPNTGCAALESLTFTINGSRCDLNNLPGPLTEVQDTVCYQTANNPFTQAVSPMPNPGPPFFHLQQSLRLLSGQYFIPTGATVLLEPGVRITIAQGASLQAKRVTFRASCDEQGMWDGLYAAEGSAGFNFSSSTITQAEHGIVQEYPDLPLTLRRCHFANNLTSIEVIPRWEVPRRAVDLTTRRTYIEDCIFDAPTAFLEPWLDLTYANVHVLLGGWPLAEAWQVTGNRFAQALIGIYGEARNSYQAGLVGLSGGGGLSLQGNTFVGCPMAGVLSHLSWQGSLTDNTFILPTNPVYPGLPQVDALLNELTIPAMVQQQPVGFYANALYSDTHITGNLFTAVRAGHHFGSLAQPAFTTPTGLWVEIETPDDLPYAYAGNGGPPGLRLQNNTFENLGVGARFAAEEGQWVTDNEFRGNRLNLFFANQGGEDIHQTVFTLRRPSVWLSCNTFRRPVTATGDNVALWFGPQTSMQFIAPRGQQAASGRETMKNWFDGTSTNGKYWNLYLDGPPPTGLVQGVGITYGTFTREVGSQLPGVVTVQAQVPPSQLVNQVNPPVGKIFVTGTRRFEPAFSCYAEDGNNFLNGIQTRPGQGANVPTGTVAHLDIPVPNPAATVTTFAYELPDGTMTAELLLRESVQGQVVAQRPLAISSTSSEVSIDHLRPGLYLATLLVNGRPTASVRLQVVR